MRDYYEGLDNMDVFGPTYVVVNGKVHARINAELPEDRTEQHREVLRDL